MSGMKVGGGAAGTFDGGGGSIGSKFTEVGKFDGGSNVSGKTNDAGSGTLNFASASADKIGAPGVQFGGLAGNKTSQAWNGSSANEVAVANGQNSDQNSTINGITQLLNAIVQLLKGQSSEGDNKTGTDAGNASGSGSNASQEASDSGDILTQLMEMIKKMLGQQSSEGPDGSANAVNQSDKGSNGSQESGQDSSGLAGKLGSALQMLGLGTLLSTLQSNASTGAEGGSEVSK